MEFIDIQRQYREYKQEINLRMQAVLDHGRFIMGPEIEELERLLAKYVGVSHCISVASGTDSLEIALRALGVGYGDEVITVPFSWISSAEVISLVGATPVFVDIEPLGFTLDHELLERAISERTKAIIPVGLYGQMPNMELINEIASRHGVPVIEDAAQSFGSKRNGMSSCGSSLIGSTSFFPAKPLGCYGDGGALFTNDDELAEKMKSIRTHGGIHRHHHTLIGMNGRFDTLQAAVLLAKLPHFDDEIRARERVAARYEELLAAVCPTPKNLRGNSHVYAQYVVRVPSDRRDSIIVSMKSDGIPTAIYYPKCFHEQPVFAHLGYAWGAFPVSEIASREVLGLPMHPFLNDSDVESVVRAFKKALA